MKLGVLGIAASAMALSGCASAGLDLSEKRHFHISQAEPLFGEKLDKCMDDPGTLISIVSNNYDIVTKECANLARSISAYVKQVGEQKTFNVPAGFQYSEAQRNELIDALIAVSNRKCGDYAAFLKTHDGSANSLLAELAIVTGGLGSIVSGAGAAKALSGTSAMVAGSRSAINESWFSNQTIHVLASGFIKVREHKLADITNREGCTVDKYSVMAGIGDAMQYHSACSLLTGLSEAAKAIDRADQPGMETMRRQLADLQSISAQANQFISASYSVDPVQRNLLQGEVTRSQNDYAAALSAVASLQGQLGSLTQALTATPPSDPQQLAAFQLQLTTIPQQQKSVSDQLTAALASANKKQDALSAANRALATFLDKTAAAQRDAAAAAANPKGLVQSGATVRICPYSVTVEGQSKASG